MKNNKTDRGFQSPHRVALLVAGMHRSGTSALTRILNLLGAQLPSNLWQPQEDNVTGFWESQNVTRLNDELLAEAHSCWDSILPIDFSQVNPEQFELLRRRAQDLLERDFAGSSCFVIKDPRMCRLLPFWVSILKEWEVQPYVIVPYRHPLEVAASLAQRNGFSREKSIYMWLRYTSDIIRHSANIPRAVVSYNDLLRDWQSTVQNLAKDLDICWPVNIESITGMVGDFLDIRIRHHNLDGSTVGSGRFIDRLADQLYTALNSKSKKLASLAESINQTLTPMEQVLAPFIVNEPSQKKMWMQLYFDVGDGFVVKDSIVNMIKPEEVSQEIVFDLAGKGRLRALRLDPLNDSVRLEIESICLFTAEGEIDLLGRIKSNARLVLGNEYFFETSDPQITFDCLGEVELANARQLFVKIHFIASGTDAVFHSLRQLNIEKDLHIDQLLSELGDVQHFLIQAKENRLNDPSITKVDATLSSVAEGLAEHAKYHSYLLEQTRVLDAAYKKELSSANQYREEVTLLRKKIDEQRTEFQTQSSALLLLTNQVDYTHEIIKNWRKYHLLKDLL